MSDMADHIGEVPISCTQIIYTLLCTTNIGIAYKCHLYAETWRIKSLYTLLYTLHMDIAISAVYTPYFDV